jgi:hypothetical protein
VSINPTPFLEKKRFERVDHGLQQQQESSNHVK